MANEIVWSGGLDGETSYEYWIMQNQIVEALYEVLAFLPFVRRANLAGIMSNAARFPKMPKLTASAIASESTDISANTAFAPTQTTLTVGEAGLKLFLGDLAEVAAIHGVMDYAAEAGKAVGEKIVQDLVALGAGFSNSVGTTNVDLTVQTYTNANAALLVLNVPPPFVTVMHPNSYYQELVPDMGTTGLAALGSAGGSVRGESNDLPAPVSGGMVGNVLGNTLLISASVGEDGNSDKENFTYAPSRALGFVERWIARVELERDASLRGTEIVVTAAYAVGEIDDTSGQRIVSDGA